MHGDEYMEKFAALMEGVNNDPVKNAFLNFQKSLEYNIEENNVIREVLRDKYKYKQPVLLLCKIIV